MLALQFVQEDGQVWEAVSDDNASTLTRKDGGYEQYKEEHDSEEELKESMKEIAPLDQWQEWDQ